MNELTQKNAELGRFLFCERYTLQPVKNSLFIAEGQDLKRGAVVDVNGVLVGTNSLMPYAVLENDCDTRTKGAFASVFVKGEFNFDKLFFAEGLSKEDLDNIVYNGSGIGLVIKPYDYEKGFSPKQQEQMEQVEKQENINRIILAQIYNPLNLPAKTIRCKFTSGYTPTMGTSQTLVDSDNNVWDIGFDTGNGLFSSNTNLLQVLGANTSSVTDMNSMFYGCTSLTSLPLFDTSSVTNTGSMFRSCTNLKSVPLFDTSSVLTMGNMFRSCTNLKSVPLFDTSAAETTSYMFHTCTSLDSVPLFDTSSVTNMSGMLYKCSSLTSVPLFDTSSVTNISNAFNGCKAVTVGALALYQQASTQTTPPTEYSNAFTDCGANTTTGAAELAQIPESWGGTAAG